MIGPACKKFLPSRLSDWVPSKTRISPAKTEVQNSLLTGPVSNITTKQRDVLRKLQQKDAFRTILAYPFSSDSSASDKGDSASDSGSAYSCETGPEVKQPSRLERIRSRFSRRVAKKTVTNVNLNLALESEKTIFRACKNGLDEDVTLSETDSTASCSTSFISETSLEELKLRLDTMLPGSTGSQFDTGATPMLTVSEALSPSDEGCDSDDELEVGPGLVQPSLLQESYSVSSESRFDPEADMAVQLNNATRNSPVRASVSERVRQDIAREDDECVLETCLKELQSELMSRLEGLNTEIASREQLYLGEPSRRIARIHYWVLLKLFKEKQEVLGQLKEIALA